MVKILNMTIKYNRFHLLFLTVVLIFGCKEIKKEEKAPITPEAQLNEIMSFWPGRYNNDQQIIEAQKAGEDIWLLDDTGKNGWLQIESHYIKLNNPTIGENVLYVEEYRDHEPDSIYRQRIYTLNIDSTKTIRVKMWTFKDKKKYVGAWKNPKVLLNITAKEIRAYPDKCDLIVTKQGDTYTMKMNGMDCAFGDKVFNYQVKLIKDMFSYRDKITELSTGNIISTAAKYAYHNLDKIE